MLTASEAVYGFAAFLTGRKERTVFSSTDDAAPIPPLIEEFCRVNGLPEPRDDWANHLVHPTS